MLVETARAYVHTHMGASCSKANRASGNVAQRAPRDRTRHEYSLISSRCLVGFGSETQFRAQSRSLLVRPLFRHVRRRGVEIDRRTLHDME